MKLCLVFASLAALFLLAACATTGTGQGQDMSSDQYRTGTPSPLNTGANPWTNVNPQVTGAAVAGRP